MRILVVALGLVAALFATPALAIDCQFDLNARALVMTAPRGGAPASSRKVWPPTGSIAGRQYVSFGAPMAMSPEQLARLKFVTMADAAPVFSFDGPSSAALYGFSRSEGCELQLLVTAEGGAAPPRPETAPAARVEAAPCGFDTRAKALVTTARPAGPPPEWTPTPLWAGEPRKVAGKTYHPYGLPRTVGTGDIIRFRLVSDADGRYLFRLDGDSAEVLYLFTNGSRCEFQPLLVEASQTKPQGQDEVAEALRKLLGASKPAGPSRPVATAPVGPKVAPPSPAAPERQPVNVLDPNDPSVALNRAIAERDRKIEAQNIANRAAYTAAVADYEASLKQRQAEAAQRAAADQRERTAKEQAYQAELARYNAEVAAKRAEAEAAQRRYQAEYAAWEAKAKACQAGDVAQCAP